jgi:ethanolamine permease
VTGVLILFLNSGIAPGSKALGESWEPLLDGLKTIFGSGTSASLLYMAVFGAVISYFMQCTSFILLRQRMPLIERPYRSPVGEWGAAIAGVIALVSLGAILYNADYRPGVYGVAIVYLVAVAYFAVAGRHRLVLSPEEEFALSQGEHGHPETEGYGRTRVEDYGRAPAEESPAPELGS